MLNFVIALAAEAKPIIDYWRLKKLQTWQPFPVFATDHCRLIISGIGRTNSAAATAWLAATTRPENAHKPEPGIWLNIGLAGHGSQDIGTMLNGHKIIERGSGKYWYPPQIKSPLSSSAIVTVDKVTTDYTADTLHEMEASGFYATAQRFSTSELIQCVKIVSDNKNNPVQLIDAKFASALIAGNIEPLAEYIRCLEALANNLDAPASMENYHRITSQYQFSTTQKLQLQRLLQRYTTLFGENASLPDETGRAVRASLILQTLRDRLNKAEVSISND